MIVAGMVEYAKSHPKIFTVLETILCSPLGFREEKIVNWKINMQANL